MSASYGAEPEPFRGPHAPKIPKSNEPGRLEVHGILLNGWLCRWCKTPLGALWTPRHQGKTGSALICPDCDAPSKESAAP